MRLDVIIIADSRVLPNFDMVAAERAVHSNSHIRPNYKASGKNLGVWTDMYGVSDHDILRCDICTLMNSDVFTDYCALLG